MTIIHSQDQPRSALSAERHRQKGKKTLRAAIFGFFVDMFDVYLPVIALAPAISYFIADSASR